MPMFLKPRWLTYSVRTLLLAVTIICLWLGHEWRIVQERKAVRDLLQTPAVQMKTIYLYPANVTIIPLRPRGKSAVPLTWIRQLMGDVQMPAINCSGLTEKEVERVNRAFPESQLWNPRYYERKRRSVSQPS
jgi:hypothetical protein